jgi:hypothetical protein
VDLVATTTSTREPKQRAEYLKLFTFAPEDVSATTHSVAFSLQSLNAKSFHLARSRYSTGHH